jgi:hypothetical protein
MSGVLANSRVNWSSTGCVVRRRRRSLASRLAAVIPALALCTLGTLGAQRPVAAGSDSAPKARISGTVMDSTHGRPLAGADVQLVSFADRALIRSVTTDSLGAFDLRDVPEAEYLVGFQHPRLDSLQLAAPVARLSLGDGEHLVLTLAIPGVRTIYAARCGAVESGTARAAPDGSTSPRDDALFIGHGRDSDQRPLDEQATVAVEWLDVLVGRGGSVAEPQERVVRVGAGGRFVVCGLPPDATLAVRVRRGSVASATVELEMPAGGLLVRDLLATFAVAEGGDVSMASDSLGERTAERTTDRSEAPVAAQASVRGRVATADGTPVPRARVRMVGGADEVRTDEEGRFTLPRAPLGTSMLEVAAIGYMPRRLPVDVTTAGRDSLRVTLTATRNQLSALSVTAESWRSGFAQRSARGTGSFLDEADIRRLSPFVVADALRRVPGIRISPTGSFSPKLYLKFGRKFCEPSVYIDGKRMMFGTSNLDAVLDLDDLVAVEIYRQPGEVPAEFHSEPGCGAILFWRRATPQRR